MKFIISLTIFFIGLILVSLLSTSNQFILDAATFNSSLLPGADNIYDLGFDSSPKWKDASFSGNLLIGNNLSIGTTTISEKLTVINGNITQNIFSYVPIITNTINTNIGPVDIFISGRYAYVVNMNSNTLQIFDVSNPSSPQNIGTVGTGASPVSIFISGRYAYVVNRDSNTLQIFDISGMESVSANIHSLEAGNLQVRNDIITQGQLQVSGGINVGTGGIFSAGPISVSIASTTQTDAISAYFQGQVGIATTTPTQKLEVNGGIRLFTGDIKPACNSTSTRGTLWFTASSSALTNKDVFEVCAKNVTDIYNWEKLY